MCYLIKLLLGIFGCGFGLLNNSMGFCLGSENTSTREEKNVAIAGTYDLAVSSTEY
jgi:hypothetical protein